MKTIVELRRDGDVRVSIHDMHNFEAALLGGRGDLDAWLECSNEEDVRLHIGKLLHLSIADLQHENKMLRTERARMRKLEPYCWTTSPPSGRYSRFAPEVASWAENGWKVVPLYDLSGGNADLTSLNVDDLAQFIRSIDGKNDLGAGALAERIVEWLSAQGVLK